MVSFPYSLLVPSQGVSLTLANADEVQKFLAAEQAFFSRMTGILGANVIFGNLNYGNINVVDRANRFFDGVVRGIKSENFESFEQYVAAAQAHRILIGQGRIGREVARLSKSDDVANQQQARWMTYVLCPDWTESEADNKVISAFRAAFAANPITLAYGDLVTATDAMNRALSAAEVSETAKGELENFIREKTDIFDRLEQLYRTKLTLDEPALTWEKIADAKTKAWGWWLSFFAVLVFVPVALSVYYWPTIAKNVHELTVGANGTFSIAGLATISVPTLLYAWLLKNVSRIFIGNLNLADDAAHRRSLALTYMGLIQDEKHPASDQDRAIILNALFRPLPSQAADEGPPAGVLELIRGK